MKFLDGILGKLLQLAVAGCVLSFAGCGNSCFVGFSNNGNGGIIVKGGNPPPVCTLNQAQGMVRLKLSRVRTCVDCAPIARVQHIYVSLRGVQIQPESRGKTETSWLELMPELKAQPRRIDLIGDSNEELPLGNIEVPADIYSRLRLQLASDVEAVGTECGGLANCVVMADGPIEPLRFAHEPELVLGAAPGSVSLVVLPESTSELYIQVMLQSLGEDLSTASRRETRLAGEFRVLRENLTD